MILLGQVEERAPEPELPVEDLAVRVAVNVIEPVGGPEEN